MQVMLLIGGIYKGESSNALAAELELDYKTVLELCHAIQANTEDQQPEESLPDEHLVYVGWMLIVKPLTGEPRQA